MSKEVVCNLVNRLNYYAHCYYNQDKSVVDDATYDRLFRELLALEVETGIVLPESPTQRVGAPVTSIGKIRHRKEMLSLDNAFDEEEIRNFVKKLQTEFGEIDISLEYKFDGAAISLYYRDGMLHEAATRGDGVFGENVIAAARTITNLPLKLKSEEYNLVLGGEVLVRGEVIIFKEDFDNSEYASPRNLASGSLRLLDPKEVKKRKLRFFAYDIVVLTPGDEYSEWKTDLTHSSIERTITPPKFTYHHQAIELGQIFQIPCQTQITNIETAIARYQELTLTRNELPFEIDGLVIKVDNLALRTKLGSTSHAPRWAVACKFPSETQKTEILQIDFQISRFGTLTPVATVTPVTIGGVTVSRVSLHNLDYITKLNLGIGATVNIVRSGDVIPKIHSVLKPAPALRVMSSCPYCQSDLVKDTFLRCPYSGCSGVKIKVLEYFVSKDCFDINALGSKVIALLFEHDLIKRPLDLFKLTVEDLLKLPGFQTKRATKIFTSIQEKREISFDRFINALGIPNVGTKLAKTIAHATKNLEHLLATPESDLRELSDIGENTARAISQFLHQNREEIIQLGASISIAKVPSVNIHKHESEILDETWLGQKIVITGSFAISRDEIIREIESLGASVVSSLSKKVDIVLSGEKPGSKLAKAQELGLKVIGEEELRELLPNLGI